jgi:hypothetical protein
MLTREEILARKTGQEVITLPGGGQVKVRGLTRDEALAVRDRDTVGAKDNFVIATGLVDPALTEDDVAAWAATGDVGDMTTISEAISRLSGMMPGQAKDATKSVPRRRK